MKGRGASLLICTGGHMSDLLIDAQLHFFQKLHDHRVVIKLPSKYHTIQYTTPLYSLLLLLLSFFFFLNFISSSSSSTLAWNFLTCIFLNWDCAKSRSSKRLINAMSWLRIIIPYTTAIYQLVKKILHNK